MQYVFSSIFVYLLIICDYLDGKIARLSIKYHNYGSVLYSIADSITFILLPAFMTYNKTNNMYLSSIFCLAGWFRLIKFVLYNMDNSKYFIGLSTAIVTVIILILYSFINNNYLFGFLILLLSYGLNCSLIRINKIEMF